MSNELKIELTETDRLLFEYYTYKLSGLIILHNQYVSNTNSYDSIYLNRLIELYSDTYNKYRKVILDVVHNKVKINNILDYRLNESTLTIIYN